MPEVSSKNYPFYTKLQPIKMAGQTTHHYLVFKKTGLIYSTLPRDFNGNILHTRKQIRRMRYGRDDPNFFKKRS